MNNMTPKELANMLRAAADRVEACGHVSGRLALRMSRKVTYNTISGNLDKHGEGTLRLTCSLTGTFPIPTTPPSSEGK